MKSYQQQMNSLKATAKDEETPQNQYGFVDFGEDDVCIQVLFDDCAFEQCLDFFLHGERVTFEQVLDKQLFAGIEPIPQELLGSSGDEPQSRQRIVRCNAVKIITTVTETQGIQVIAQSGFFHESGNFGILETETPVEFGIEQRADAHVVKPKKNAFACDAQIVRHNRLLEILMALQLAFEKLAKDLKGVFEVSMRVSSVNRCIVFVNEHDGALAINIVVEASISGATPYRIDITWCALIDLPLVHVHAVDDAPQVISGSFEKPLRTRRVDRRGKPPWMRRSPPLERVDLAHRSLPC